MRLPNLVAGYDLSGAVPELEIAGLTADSRAVQPGWLFVALPRMDRAGFKHDGHDYAAAAVQAGAAAVIGERELAGLSAPCLVAPDTRWLLPRLASRFYGDPTLDLTLVGCTGTNGKTTSTYMLEAVWQQLGWPCAVVGTVENRVRGERRAAGTTTPDPVSLQALWRACLDQSVEHAVIEVSSHALHQQRVGATRFEAALFTNLTQDHLDYHPDLEEYFECKALLFDPDDWGHRPKAVINVDDEHGRRLLERLGGEAVSFGFGAEASVRAVSAEYSQAGTTFEVATPAGSWRQSLLTLGAYNVANALGVIGLALAMDLPLEQVRAGLAGCSGAPGRLEQVRRGQAFTVLVDYAHTPDAVGKATAALRDLTAGRLITVFGCGGDRDRTKRPLMGRIAAEVSDVVVVTSDNPRTEDPQAIVADIVAGVPAGSCELTVEVDRRRAIGLALGLAKAGDTVLILGKGHEDYQILGTTKHPFDDRLVAAEWLEARA